MEGGIPNQEEAVVITIIIVLFVLGHLADWQLQCEEHNWPGLLWERHARGPRWPWYADWFPHDRWHTAQVMDNWCPLLAVTALVGFGPFPFWWNIGAIVPIYAVTRFVGFTVPRKLSLGY